MAEPGPVTAIFTPAPVVAAIKLPEVQSSEEYLPLLIQSLVDGQANEGVALVDAALGAGIAPQKLKDAGIMPALEKILNQYVEGDVFIPEVILAGRAIKTCLARIATATGQPDTPENKIVLGMPQKDFMHDYFIHAQALSIYQYEFVDIGEGSGEDFAQAIRESGAKAVVIAADFKNEKVSEILDHLKQAGLRDQVKVQVILRRGSNPQTMILSGADAVSDSLMGSLEFANWVYGVK